MTFYAQAPDLTLDAMPTVATLLSMAQSLQAMVEQAAASQGIALPDRRVIYMAPIPADCPQLATLIGGWALDPSTPDLIVCNRSRWVAQLGVGITRKTPALPSATGDLPRPEQLLAAAQMASDDAELLLTAVGSLNEIGGDVSITTPAAEGGLQSVTLMLRTPAFGGI